MCRAPTRVVTMDLYEHMIRLSASIAPCLRLTVSDKKEVVYGIAERLTKDILDDLITENLYWTDSDTVATPERYLKNFTVNSGKEDILYDLLDLYICDMEGILHKQDLLPSWAFFEVTVKSTYVVIYSHGDFRIEDWMKKHGKNIKKTRFCNGR